MGRPTNNSETTTVSISGLNWWHISTTLQYVTTKETARKSRILNFCIFFILISQLAPEFGFSWRLKNVRHL